VDNSPLVSRIVELRRELAAPLGYTSTPKYRSCRKMAESPQQVLAFLEDLAKRARPSRRRMSTSCVISRAASSACKSPRRGTWHTRPEKLRVKRYAFSEQE